MQLSFTYSTFPIEKKKMCVLGYFLSLFYCNSKTRGRWARWFSNLDSTSEIGTVHDKKEKELIDRTLQAILSRFYYLPKYSEKY